MTLGIKTQTRRATDWKDGILNANLVSSKIELGFCTTKDWGDYEIRTTPLVEISIGCKAYRFEEARFIEMIKRNAERYEVRE